MKGIIQGIEIFITFLSILSIVLVAITTTMYIYHVSGFLINKTEVTADWTFDLSEYFSIYGIVSFFFQFYIPFVIYDFIYYIFYYTIHHSIHNYIHKHHYQISPFRGTYDGINTHIFEYVFGIYLRLWSIFILKYMIRILINGEFDIRTDNKDCLVNGYSIALFLLFSSFFLSLEHTTHAIYMPYFYDVHDHDVHHRIQRSNYGQFIMLCDRIFGSYHDYFDVKQRKQRENKIANQLHAKELNPDDIEPSRSEKELKNISDLNRISKMPKYVAVTGGGMAGLVLCQMLFHKGYERVYIIDINKPNESAKLVQTILKR